MDYRQAKLYAYKRLALKNQLTSELRDALLKKGVSNSDIQKILEELTSIGLLNDHSWIESFIRREVQKKNGPGLILKKLKAKGVHFPHLLELVNQLSNSEAQKSSIQRLLETKYRTKNLKDFKEKQKVIASLFRKGFDSEVIGEVISWNIDN